jgi:hypothetical protein
MKSEVRGQGLVELIIVLPVMIATGVLLLPLASQTSRHFADASATLSIASSAATFSDEERKNGGWDTPRNLSLDKIAEETLNPSQHRNGAGDLENGLFGDALRSTKASLNDSCLDNRQAVHDASEKQETVTLKTCSPRMGYEKKIAIKDEHSTAPNTFSAEKIFLPSGLMRWENRAEIALPNSLLELYTLETPNKWMSKDQASLSQIRHRLQMLVFLTQKSSCIGEYCARSPSKYCAIAAGAEVMLSYAAQKENASSLCPSTQMGTKTIHNAATAIISARIAEAAAIELRMRSQIPTLDKPGRVN